MPEPISLPKVFLGSSLEDLRVLKMICNRLKSCAEVTLWNDRSIVKGGKIFIDFLIKKARGFDFAVFLFGPNDVATIRRAKQLVPRDNVVFETGLFMRELGRERTLVIVPIILRKRSQIRILSDLSGLNPVTYKIARRRPNPGQLIRALTPACQEITNDIKDLGFFNRGAELVRPGPKTVIDANALLSELAQESLRKGTAVTIDNIALDMEETWPALKNNLIHEEEIRNVTWRSLMIASESAAFRKVATPSFSQEKARQNKRDIRNTLEKEEEHLRKRRVKFACREYKDVAIMHGFLFNDAVLLLTLCDMDNKGGVIAKQNRYYRFDRPSKGAGHDSTSAYFFNVFKHWFEYYWTKGATAKVWPR